MSSRLHITPVYQIEYGDTISSDYTDAVIDIFRDSETGYINDDYTEFEMDFIELDEIMTNTKDPKLKEILKKILDESDRHNDYVHLTLF